MFLQFPAFLHNFLRFYVFVISVILDGFQDPCDLRTSNIGQQLLSYIAVPEQPGQSPVVRGDFQVISGDFW